MKRTRQRPFDEHQPAEETESSHDQDLGSWDVVYAQRTSPRKSRAGQILLPCGRFQQLDSLRGLAAVLVIINHYLLMSHSPHEAIVHFSPHGSVPLFFLLSGLVLAVPYLQGKQETYAKFLVRRFLRIYCPYLYGLMLSVAGAALFHHALGWGAWADQTWSHPVSGDLVLSHVLLVGNYECAQFNTAFWSLVQEMRISLCFPFLFSAINKLRTPWAMLLACLCSLACSRFQPAFPGLHYAFVTFGYLPSTLR